MDAFKRPDSADLRDMLTDAAVSSLAERGLIELNVSVLARWIGVTPQAVTQRLGGPAGARARVFHLVARTFGDRWLAWVTPPLIADPPVIRVPETAAERHGVAVWAAFGELARGEQAAGNGDIAAVVADVAAVERSEVRRQLERAAGARVDGRELAGLHALTAGLRSGLASPEPPCDLAVGRELLARAVERTIASAPLADT